MTDYSYCPACRTFHAFSRHLPEFRVRTDEERVGTRFPDDDDYFCTIHATDPEDAAQRFAEQHDEGGDYTIVGGSPEVVIVQDARGRRTRWRVSGETVAVYHAEEVEEEEPTP